MASQRTQPFWRTRRVRRGATEEHATYQTPLSSQDSQEPSTAINESESASVKPQCLPIPRRQAAQQLVAYVNEETQKSINLLRAPNLPQEDGFVGIFIEVCSWQADFRSETKRRRGQKSAYAGRIGYQRPLDTTKIGEGASFSVYKRCDNGSSFERQSKLVVMKDSKVRFTRDGQATDQEALNSLRTEIRVLSHTPLRHHPNIVKLLDIRWDHPNLNQESLGPTLYLEYAKFGTLTDYFTIFQPSCTFKSVASSIVKGIWDGLYALHQCRIVHGDLKPSNILIFCEGEKVIAKLSDFGCSILISQEISNKATLKGFSPPWDAPEAGTEIDLDLLGKTDIYSFGLIYCWVRLGGQDPFALDSDSINCLNAFGLCGSRSSKLESLKRLKQSRDLSSELQKGVMGVQDPGDEFYGCLEQEVHRVAYHALVVNPKHRTLDIELNMHPLAADFTDIPFTWESSEAQRPVWTSASPWVLPLKYDPDEKIPSKRFVQVAQRFTSTESITRASRKDINILLFRSHLEGFGVSQSYELAAGFLEAAARFGDPICQSMSRLFHDIVGASSVPLKFIEHNVAAILQGVEEPAGKDNIQLAKLDNLLYNLAKQQRTIICLKDEAMLSEEKLLAEVQKPNTGREINAWLGHPLAGHQMSLIHHASARGWRSVIEGLIRSDSNWDCNDHLSRHDSYGYTPFLYACRFGHSEVALRLLEIGPSAAIIPSGEAPHAIYLLHNLLRQVDGQHTRLREVADKIIAAGADPNQESLKDCREDLILGTLSRAECEDITWQHLGNPLCYAIWLGDMDVVQCLLDIGAIPDLLCLHLATALHRVDIMRILLSSTACVWPLIQDCSVRGQTILETAMSDAPVFQSSRRLIGTRVMYETSLQQTIDLILHQNSNAYSLMSAFTMASRILHCCRLKVTNHNLIKQLLSPVEDHDEHTTAAPELVFIAVAWNHGQIVELLLNSSAHLQDSRHFGALHVCAIYPVSSKLCGVLHESFNDIDIKQKNKPASDLETPFQFAVACQNFEVADFLFENGASKDEIITSTAGYLENSSLLGWLIPITWSESQNRIRYLFDRYSTEPVPQFLVRPRVGRSALQEAAGQSMKSKYEEQEMQGLMEYLITKYPGSRHLEYQRIDNATEIFGDAKHSGMVQAMVNGKLTATENTYHFHQRIGVYPETKKKEHNGTALHFAVRSVNYPAVRVLLEAGADVSAMIGLPLPESKFSTSTKGASTYAAKENCWASTVLDFAFLVHSSFEDEPAPLSSTSTCIVDSYSMCKFQKERSKVILELLQQKGAANSTTFIRKFKEKQIFRTRREKGTLAAMKLFKKDLSDGLGHAKNVYRTTKRDIKEIQSTKQFTPAAAKINFANELFREGKLDEAMKLYQEGREQEEQNPPSWDSHDKMAVYLNMGVVYQEKANYIEAEKMYMKALEDQMKWLGGSHSATLHTMTNIALLFITQEKLLLAEKWVQKALKGTEKVLGLDDPQTLITVMALGSLRLIQGRAEEAEAVYQRALAGLELAVGPQDSNTLTCYHNLGVVYKSSSRWKESKAMLQKAVNGREAMLGMNHKDTIGSVEQLGFVLGELEELEEAIALLLRALTRYQEKLNFDDSKITITAWRLAGLYRRKKDLTASMRMFQTCLTGEEARFGSDHKDTLITKMQIGTIFVKQNQYEKAIEVYSRVLEAKAKTPDSGDKYSLETRWNLASIFREPGRSTYDLRTARTHYELATDGYTILLGGDSDDALGGNFKLGHVCMDLNDLSAAQTYFTRAQEGFERNLGPGHEKTLDAIDQMANVSYMLEDHAQAAALFEKALEYRKKTLAPDDASIARTLENISRCSSRRPCYRFNTQPHEPIGTDQNTDSSTDSAQVAGMEAAAAAKTAEVFLSSPSLAQQNDIVQSRDDEWIEQLVEERPASESSQAALWGKDSFQTLISRGATTESRDQDGLTALLWAVAHKKPDDVSLLIDMGADIHALDPVGHAPIHFACACGNERMVSRLLLAGAGTAAQDSKGMTVIHYAVCKGNPHIVRIVLDALDADSQYDLSKIVDLKNNDGSTALHIACSEGYAACVDILLERGANVSQPENQGELTPVMLAANWGHEDITMLLLSYGVETDAVSTAGLMAIHLAASKGHLSITQKLLDNGANVEAQAVSNDWTPLFWAVNNGHISTAECLIKRGAHVNARDIGWQTLMHVAASQGNTAMMRLLLENSADFGASDENYSMPLHLAADRGLLEAARLLLKHGPLDVHAKDGDGRTPLGLAASAGHEEMVGTLLEFGSLVNVKDSQESTPLHFAAAAGRDAVVRLLLNKGANVALKDNKDRSAMQLAAMGNHVKVVMAIALVVSG